MRHRLFDTFTGLFAVVQHDDGRIGTQWVFNERDLAKSRLDPSLQPALSKRIKAYFAGQDIDFTDIELPVGGPFFQRCWDACRRVDRGRTISYGELARRAGSSGAARAAGQSMRNNPLPIIIPCHRVLAAGGDLHGFAGSSNAGGRQLNVKKLLLDMESAALFVS